MIRKMMPIQEFEDYLISNLGEVYSKKRNRYLSLKIPKNKKRYVQVVLHKNGKHYYKQIHRLVVTHFLNIPKNEYFEVNHIDGNKLNNKITNLEIVTHEQNMAHASKNGLFINSYRGVNQYSIDNLLLNSFKSLTDASKYIVKNKLANTNDFNYIRQHLWNCINYKNNFAYGFIWRYASNENI